MSDKVQDQQPQNEQTTAPEVAVQEPEVEQTEVEQTEVEQTEVEQTEVAENAPVEQTTAEAVAAQPTESEDEGTAVAAGDLTAEVVHTHESVLTALMTDLEGMVNMAKSEVEALITATRQKYNNIG